MSKNPVTTALLEAGALWLKHPTVPIKEAAAVHTAIRMHGADGFRAALEDVAASASPGVARAVQAIARFASLMAPTSKGDWVMVLGISVCAARPAGRQSRAWLPYPSRIPVDCLALFLEHAAFAGLVSATAVGRLVPAIPIICDTPGWTAADASTAAASVEAGTDPSLWQLWDRIAAAGLRRPWMVSENHGLALDVRVIPIVAREQPDILLAALHNNGVIQARQSAAKQVTQAIRKQYELYGDNEGLAVSSAIVPIRDIGLIVMETARLAAETLRLR